MRVIAGSLRGRRLGAPRGQGTRPTSDRVREALFAMLGDLQGASVLDLFAGTGALGIEALSRGAARALFVERDRDALRALRSNLRALALRAPLANVRGGDALAALRDAQNGGETYDLVFVDPPYARAGELQAPLVELLPRVLSENGGRVAVESDRRAPLKLPLTALRERRYGDTVIAIYGKMSDEGSGRVPDRGRRSEAGQGDQA
ncbi:MAG TPA: 16S rRNA (guanine(966)-N(2))-methyltransferase RsmD [Solirubrobacteraceae bacterium]|nr:16S rRNA (guanine(966)-N(2))-methyltransferase RsmD [Solirubrobacteraceae bacterium]